MTKPSIDKAAVVVIGGGTGLSTMLRGIKALSEDITAIVTVTDDGGGSGVLRSELGMLPPGDIINCIQALSNAEPIIRDLLRYRFTEGHLSGQSFGNLFLAALNGVFPRFDEAVSKISDVLAITGRVLPVTNENIQLCARFAGGAEVTGQTHITAYKEAHDLIITDVSLVPASPQALPSTLAAIERADLIILGPGSLYTSVLPNLLVRGVTETICASRALKVYVGNIMTQVGETEGFTLSKHISELFKYSGCRLFDHCIANTAPLPEAMLKLYSYEGSVANKVDAEAVEALGVKLHTYDLIDPAECRSRHDSARLADAIRDFYEKNI